MKKCHILVGGSGFIAEHIREELKNFNVLLIDRKKPKNLRRNESWLEVDIRDKFSCSLSHSPGDIVVHHLAAVHFDFQEDFHETNVNGTENVIQALSACVNWIFYSSVATYGDSTGVRDEQSFQEPNNSYGKSNYFFYIKR